MNIKVHTPKSLKSGSGMSTLKQLLLSLIATTISIITFTEMVSEFYILRRQYADIMDKEYKRMFDGDSNILVSYDNLKNYDLSEHLSVCENILMHQKKILRLCQEMMEVSDEELTAFARTRQEWTKRTDHKQSDENIRIMNERKRRFQQAVEGSSQQE